MGIKICLDAGHYANYNNSPVNKDYWESKVVWELHLLLKKYLESYGIEVITTRAKQEKDLPLLERGKKAKDCDLFLSLHTNACSVEYVDYPVAIVPINGKGNDIGKKLALCISSVMGTDQKGQVISKKGSGNWDYYSVIYGAVSVDVVGIILEHSFHTNLRTTQWLLDQDNLDKLAKAEAEVIAKHFGLIKGEEKLNKNDIVTVSKGATYYNGAKVPDWVLNKKWVIKSVSGDRAVIDKSTDGEFSINSPINVKYLTKVKETDEDKVLKWAKDNGLITSETDLNKTVAFRDVITMLYRVYNGK